MYPNTVFCVLEGESSWSAFSVSYGPDGHVADLKHAIKLAMAPKLDRLSAFEISLWKISHKVTESNRNTTVKLGEQRGKKKLLHPMDPIQTHFYGDTGVIEVIVSLEVPPLQDRKNLPAPVDDHDYGHY